MQVAIAHYPSLVGRKTRELRLRNGAAVVEALAGPLVDVALVVVVVVLFKVSLSKFRTVA